MTTSEAGICVFISLFSLSSTGVDFDMHSPPSHFVIFWPTCVHNSKVYFSDVEIDMHSVSPVHY